MSGIVYSIIGIVAVLGALVVFTEPDLIANIIDPPPNIKFHDTSINKNEIRVGSSAFIVVNAINNENYSVENLTVIINAIGSNADRHLKFEKETNLGNLESEGEIFPQVQNIIIRAIDVSGTSTPFEIVVKLQYGGVTTDTRSYLLKIIS